MTKVEECLRFGKGMDFEFVWQAILEYERNYDLFFSLKNLKEEVLLFKEELERKGVDTEGTIGEALKLYGTE